MKFQDLKACLERGFARDDLRSEYPSYINQGLRSIAQDHNFFCMRHSKEITLKQGVLSAGLPNDFKELTPGRSPIFMQAQDADILGESKWLPCDVIRIEELNRRDAALLMPRKLQTLSRRGPDIYLSTDGSGFFFNIIDVMNGDAVFRVSYFRFLPDLVEDSDSNYITENYAELVKAKIKAIAFEDVQDPIAAQFEELYEVKLRRARQTDARRWIVGRKLRMGG